MRRECFIFIMLMCPILLQTQNLTDTIVPLDEVVVEAEGSQAAMLRAPQSIVQVGQSFLKQHFAGSLMHSLDRLPGVQAMTIGSGQSKPVIRGMGFNRMLVAENGIKHEGQQWGEEHGLEINQFALDYVEIVKGAGVLQYGSEAIAGVINLNSSYVPQQQLEGEIELFGRSNNESLGVAAQLGGRKNGFWYKANFSLIDYADYKIPADSIQYYSYYIKLKDRRLRNTAGAERNGGLHFGYLGEQFITMFYLSDVYAKSGFFANAHGLEVRLSEIDYDHSRRDVDLPSHSVNHFKAINHSAYRLDNLSIECDFAFQNNFRREFAESISHGFMPTPPGTLERQYDKNTLTANLGARFTLADKHSIRLGVNGEHQDNRRGGWGFIIPDFRTSSAGVFVLDRWEIADNLACIGGLRFDKIATSMDEYRDWYTTPDADGNEDYKIRALKQSLRFDAVTWSLGVNYANANWIFKANAGKSFRAPIPKELGSDGVNYHIFRYEKGNADLRPEESYQLDAGIVRVGHALPLQIQIEAFVNYFPNYIYLNPTSDYFEGLQMYHYMQSRVFRWGFEMNFNYDIIKQLELNLSGDYLYARQLSGDKRGYTLPFSPPPSATFEVKYSPHAKWSGKDGFISLDCRAVAPQNEIVPPENATPGYALLNLSAGRTFALSKPDRSPRPVRFARASVQANNLLDKRYYDHTSYYRLIDVPEPGRNFSIMIAFDF